VGALGLAALLAPLGSVARAGEPEPAASRGLRKIDTSALGTTFELRLEHAPYPCAWGKYDDPTVYAFVPQHLRLSKGGRVDVIVHFHGHNGRAKRALETHKLREQLRESRQNAILVVPQGPVDAADGDFGKLMRPRGLSKMLEELRRHLSGAAASKALGKASLAGSKSIGRVVEEKHGKRVTRAELTRGRAVFLEGLATHGTATFEEHALRDCLFGSCLVGRGSEAWFEHKHDPRSS
jgi:hypothetical protein